MLPFLSIPLPSNPPADAQEFVFQGNALLHAAGLKDAHLTLDRAPSPPNPFQDAEITLVLPEKSLEEVIQKEASRQAAQHGAKVSDTILRCEPAGHHAIRFRASATASLFLGSVSFRLSGVVRALDPDKFAFSEIELDTGSGMFGGMARAMIEPRLRQWAGTEPSLGTWMKRPVRWLDFETRAGEIRCRLRFES